MFDDVAGSFVVLKRLPNRLRCIISNSGTDRVGLSLSTQGAEYMRGSIVTSIVCR